MIERRAGSSTSQGYKLPQTLIAYYLSPDDALRLRHGRERDRLPSGALP